MPGLPFTLAINYTQSWSHLGILINESEDDQDCIAARRFQLVGQVNNVLCTLGKLDPITKNNLLHTFCFSFYGSVTWNLQHPEISCVCAARHVALRRIWRLPPNAHCDIVSVLGSNHSLLTNLY
jgi:hypothetical protein